MSLPDFVVKYTDRGECKCGECIDIGTKPDPDHPHTVNMVFFKVAPAPGALEPDRDLKAQFIALTNAHQGEFASVNPFDSNEHNYQELGAWIGDQGLAMQYMALGVMLGVFQLLSAHTMLQVPEDSPLAMKAAQAGFLSVIQKAANA